jgi:alpha-glucosidase (family GH31 glycosyl hydrolase)
MQSHRELRDANLTPEELILNVVDTFRKKRIPVDSVAYLGTGFTPTGWNKPQPSFEFNPRVFASDPREVLKKLHDKNITIAAAPPAGATNESTASREFRVEMLPAGTVKTITYNGRQTEVTF